MSKWIKRALLVGVTFVAVWLLAVIYWQTNNRLPSPSEVVLFLLLLPLALLLGVWLVRVLLMRITAGATGAGAAAASAAAPPAPSTSPAEKTDAQERTWTLSVLASAIRSPHGASPEELSQALKDKSATIDLDQELVGIDGLPLFVARVPEVDTSDTSGRLQAWMESTQEPRLEWTAEQLRALTMGREVLVESGKVALEHPLLGDYLAANASRKSTIPLPALQLLPLLPARWPQAHREAAKKWFLHELTQLGWPQERLVPSPIAASTRYDALGAIDRLMLHTHRQSLPCLGIVVACESFVSEDAVYAMEIAQQLLTSQRKDGQAPGEGAAALLLADAEQTRLMKAETPATLHRLLQTRRDKSANARGKVGSKDIQQLTSVALSLAGVAPDQIGLVLSDCDQRASRVGELMECANAVLPDLDVSEQCHCLAAACGATGHVCALTALALAHFETTTQETPSLCVSNQDEFERGVVLLRPYVEASTGNA